MPSHAVAPEWGKKLATNQGVVGSNPASRANQINGSVLAKGLTPLLSTMRDSARVASSLAPHDWSGRSTLSAALSPDHICRARSRTGTRRQPPSG